MDGLAKLELEKYGLFLTDIPKLTAEPKGVYAYSRAALYWSVNGLEYFIKCFSSH